MNYKVLYRKYRPDTFDSVIGQDYTVSILKNAIIHNKISHAYIFTGPRGTGKTSVAKIFAKAINCENPKDGNPCGECLCCQNANNNADIIEIDAASNNGVDEIRELINNVKLAPSNSKYKVYIIDEVHMMTQSAFNALLLTLEEPPRHIVFIFATTNIENVPITILSRCQRFDFHKIEIEGIISRLRYICGEENISITDEALTEIAYLAEGGMRDALSLLDQLSSSNDEITAEIVVKNYGSISNVIIEKIFENLEENNVEEIEKIISQLQESSVDYKVFLKKVIDFASNLAIAIKIGEKSSHYSYEKLKDFVFALVDVINKISIHVNPYTLILLTFLEFVKVNPQSDVSHETIKLKNEIQNKEKNIEQTFVNTKNEDISEEPEKTFDNGANDIESVKKIRINNTFYGAKKEFLLEIKNLWDAFRKSESIESSLLSLIVDVDIVVASADYAILVGKMKSTVQLLNLKLDELEKSFSFFTPQRRRFISLTEEEWSKEKQQYIENIKNKVEYQFIAEEEKPNECALIEEVEENEEDVEFLANSLFNHDKIEIE